MFYWEITFFYCFAFKIQTVTISTIVLTISIKGSPLDEQNGLAVSFWCPGFQSTSCKIYMGGLDGGPGVVCSFSLIIFLSLIFSQSFSLHIMSSVHSVEQSWDDNYR